MRRMLRLAIFFVFGVLASAAIAVFAFQAWIDNPVDVTPGPPVSTLDGASAFRHKIPATYPIGSDHAALLTDLTKRGYVVTEQDGGFRASLRWEVLPCTYRNVINWQTDSKGKISQISGNQFSRCR